MIATIELLNYMLKLRSLVAPAPLPLLSSHPAGNSTSLRGHDDRTWAQTGLQRSVWASFLP